MKLQRKLLTKEQKDSICEEYKTALSDEDCPECFGCPLQLTLGELNFCYKKIDKINNEIEKFWNKEIFFEK